MQKKRTKNKLKFGSQSATEKAAILIQARYRKFNRLKKQIPQPILDGISSIQTNSIFNSELSDPNKSAKTILGQNAVNQTDKANLLQQRSVLEQLILRAGFNTTENNGQWFISPDHWTLAADDLKSFSQDLAWKGEIPPDSLIPSYGDTYGPRKKRGYFALSSQRSVIQGFMNKVVENSIEYGEFQIKSSGSRFGSTTGQEEYPSDMETEVGGYDEPAQGSVLMSDISSASSLSSLASLEDSTNKVLSRYIALWFLTQKHQAFVEGTPLDAAVASAIRRDISTFLNSIRTHYDEFRIQARTQPERVPVQQNEQGLQSFSRNASTFFMRGPDEIASVTMGYLNTANIRMQEIFTDTFASRTTGDASSDVTVVTTESVIQERAHYEYMLQESMKLEMAHHLPYIYAKLRKWLENNRQFNKPSEPATFTPETRKAFVHEWFKLQVLEYVRRRVLKVKEILRLVNHFAVNILASQVYQEYCTTDRNYIYNLTLRGCIAQINLALSGLFYVHRDLAESNRGYDAKGNLYQPESAGILKKLPSSTTIQDTSPTTLRHAAFIIFRQLSLMDDIMAVTDVGPTRAVGEPGRQTWDSVPDNIKQLWMGVYKIASSILEKIIELTRISGMQPGEFIDFDNIVLPSEVPDGVIDRRYFADQDTVVQTYIKNWNDYIRKDVANPEITHQTLAGLSEPLYFLKYRTQGGNGFYFLDLELRQLYIEDADNINLQRTTNLFNLRVRLLRETQDYNRSLITTIKTSVLTIFSTALSAKVALNLPVVVTTIISLFSRGPTLHDSAASSKMTTRAVSNIFRLSVSFLKTVFTNIPWKLILKGITVNNAMFISGLVYTMCYYAQRNINVDPRQIEILQVPTQKRELIEWTANQLTFLSIFNSLELSASARDTICKRIVSTWAINNPELADELETRLHYIYITLVQKPGLIWLENLLVTDGQTERLVHFETFIVSEIESMLEEFPDLKERYTNLNSSNGTSKFTLPTALLSSTNFENHVDQLLTSVGQGIVQLASSEPPPPPPPATSTQFGKLAKVFEPYREFVFDVKKTGDKRGIYLKTRFGVKQVKDDKYGLYVKADGKKFHLYKWS